MNIDQEVLDALVDVDRELELTEERTQESRRRVRRMRAALESGMSHREFVRTEMRPMLVELISATLDGLRRAGSRLRRAQARALHAEGMTAEQIAGHFGVTRQRISALLRSGRDGHAGEAGDVGDVVDVTLDGAVDPAALGELS